MRELQQRHRRHAGRLFVVRGSSASPRKARAGDCWFRREQSSQRARLLVVRGERRVPGTACPGGDGRRTARGRFNVGQDALDRVLVALYGKWMAMVSCSHFGLSQS
jgi:hypothetical protein